jgi:hypothetical protein
MGPDTKLHGPWEGTHYTGWLARLKPHNRENKSTTVMLTVCQIPHVWGSLAQPTYMMTRRVPTLNFLSLSQRQQSFL